MYISLWNPRLRAVEDALDVDRVEPIHLLARRLPCKDMCMYLSLSLYIYIYTHTITYTYIQCYAYTYYVCIIICMYDRVEPIHLLAGRLPRRVTYLLNGKGRYAVKDHWHCLSLLIYSFGLSNLSLYVIFSYINCYCLSLLILLRAGSLTASGKRQRTLAASDKQHLTNGKGAM